MTSHNAVLKSESKSKLIQVSTSTQTQHIWSYRWTRICQKWPSPASNDCASLLQHIFDGPHSQQCAIISTHALTSHRGSSEDDQIWRVTKVSQFWMKTKWIFPIHRPQVPEHWVLCVVDTISQHVEFFDSLAEESKSLGDIKVHL